MAISRASVPGDPRAEARADTPSVSTAENPISGKLGESERAAAPTEDRAGARDDAVLEKKMDEMLSMMSGLTGRKRRRDAKITQADVTRIVKGVVAAGVEVRAVVVDADGKMRVIAGKPETVSTETVREEPNEWD